MINTSTGLIINYYTPYIRGVIGKMVNDANDRDDIYQDVMLQFWKSGIELKDKTDPKNYVRRAVINKIYQYWNKLTKNNQRTIEVIDYADIDNYACYEEDFLGAEMLLEQLEQLDQLSHKQWLVIDMFSKGFTKKEIMKRMKLSMSAMDTHLSRIRKKIVEMQKN